MTYVDDLRLSHIVYGDPVSLQAGNHQTYSHPIFSSKICHPLSAISDLCSLSNWRATLKGYYTKRNIYTKQDELDPLKFIFTAKFVVFNLNYDQKTTNYVYVK
jgi:hypothetical protein